MGNCYTGAVFVNLLSLVCEAGPKALLGKRVGVFSYGSGSVATLYSLRAREPTKVGRVAEPGRAVPGGAAAFTLGRIQSTVGLRARLEQARRACSVEEFSQAMAWRAEHYGAAPYQPSGPVANVAPGAFYLESVDEKHHRFYARQPQFV